MEEDLSWWELGSWLYPKSGRGLYMNNKLKVTGKRYTIDFDFEVGCMSFNPS